MWFWFLVIGKYLIKHTRVLLKFNKFHYLCLRWSVLSPFSTWKVSTFQAHTIHYIRETKADLSTDTKSIGNLRTIRRRERISENDDEDVCVCMYHFIMLHSKTCDFATLSTLKLENRSEIHTRSWCALPGGPIGFSPSHFPLSPWRYVLHIKNILSLQHEHHAHTDWRGLELQKPILPSFCTYKQHTLTIDIRIKHPMN